MWTTDPPHEADVEQEDAVDKETRRDRLKHYGTPCGPETLSYGQLTGDQWLDGRHTAQSQSNMRAPVAVVDNVLDNVVDQETGSAKLQHHDTSCGQQTPSHGVLTGRQWIDGRHTAQSKTDMSAPVAVVDNVLDNVMDQETGSAKLQHHDTSRGQHTPSHGVLTGSQWIDGRHAPEAVVDNILDNVVDQETGSAKPQQHHDTSRKQRTSSHGVLTGSQGIDGRHTALNTSDMRALVPVAEKELNNVVTQESGRDNQKHQDPSRGQEVLSYRELERHQITHSLVMVQGSDNTQRSLAESGLVESSKVPLIMNWTTDHQTSQPSVTGISDEEGTLL